MARDIVLDRLLPLIGGADNISFQRMDEQRLFLRLKDESLPDLQALRALNGVKSCTLEQLTKAVPFRGLDVI